MAASIQYCGHSAVLITTETGKKIAIDPFLKGNPKCPEALYDPGHLDLIVLTHGHGDHVGSTIELAKKYRPTICATYELTTLLTADGVDASLFQPMNNGGTVTLPNLESIKVSLTNAFHSNSYDSTDGKTYYAGQAAGTVVHLESGKTIYHAGDTCLFSDMKLIGEEYRPEVAFLPIGDRFTMGPKDAALAASMVKPRVAIPVHYATFGMLSGTAEEFMKYLQPREIKGVVLEPGATFDLGN